MRVGIDCRSLFLTAPVKGNEYMVMTPHVRHSFEDSPQLCVCLVMAYCELFVPAHASSPQGEKIGVWQGR